MQTGNARFTHVAYHSRIIIIIIIIIISPPIKKQLTFNKWE